MTKKKIGVWMYENDNGINIKKQLVSSLKDMGYEVYSDFDMRECCVKNGKVYAKDGYCLSDVDIFYHMNADEQNQYQNDILRLLELSGVHVFNDYQSFIYCKDKVISNLLLRKNGILVPPSMLINNKLTKEELKKIIDEWGTVIVKPRTNHGGKGIIKIDNYELFCDFYEATKVSTKDYYLEKFIPFKFHDYRVEVFNGEVIGTYCRGKCGTYKTNISSGGSMEDITVPEEFKKIALKAAKTLNVTTTIVDMILSEEDKKIYVLEVNPIMGIFLEEGMKAGTKMPIRTKIPKSFKTDKIKLRKIINYIDNYLKSN